VTRVSKLLTSSSEACERRGEERRGEGRVRNFLWMCVCLLYPYQNRNNGWVNFPIGKIHPVYLFKEGVLFNFLSTMETQPRFWVLLQQFPDQIFGIRGEKVRKFELSSNNLFHNQLLVSTTKRRLLKKKEEEKERGRRRKRSKQITNTTNERTINHTEPTSMSYMRAPKLHQSTTFP
jgi:hypothetical protein